MKLSDEGLFECYAINNTSYFLAGISATAVCIGVATILLILLAVIFGGRVLKRKMKSRSAGRVRTWKTRSGITIKISPATPRDNGSETSVDGTESYGNSTLLNPLSDNVG